MKRIALVAALVLASVAVLSTPSAHAQVQCGTNGQTTCIGTPKNQVRIGGPLILDKAIVQGNSTTGILIDGGVGINGSVTVTGSLTVSGSVTGSSGTYKASVVDAGTLCVQSGQCATRLIGFTTAAIDFASTTTTCTDSGGTTVTGAQTTDSCVLGMPSTLTAGGTGLNASYTCYVSSSNTVKVRHCAAGTADDPGSVTFTGFVISQQ